MKIRLAGCVILDDQHKMYLLHRNRKGVIQWELPGGKVEPGELDEDAAVRELKEELGIDVRATGRLGDAAFSEAGREFEYVWFMAMVESGVPRICEPDTFDDFRSFTIDELGSLELSGNMKNLYTRLKDGIVSLPTGVTSKL